MGNNRAERRRLERLEREQQEQPHQPQQSQQAQGNPQSQVAGKRLTKWKIVTSVLAALRLPDLAGFVLGTLFGTLFGVFFSPWFIALLPGPVVTAMVHGLRPMSGNGVGVHSRS